MKSSNYTRFNIIASILATSVLAACGGHDAPVLPPVYQANGAGTCIAPGGVKDRTVRGNFASGGATLTLDLYSQPQGGVAAIGQLSVASVENLFGTDVFNGTFDYNNPSINGYGYTGNNSPLKTCVSTAGFLGSLQDGGSIQDIGLTLRGDAGVVIKMGNGIGYVTSFIDGNYLEGDVVLKLGNYPETLFTLTRP